MGSIVIEAGIPIQEMEGPITHRFPKRSIGTDVNKNQAQM
jgi:hypothetical protein